jgi:hypothetical protein
LKFCKHQSSALQGAALKGRPLFLLLKLFLSFFKAHYTPLLLVRAGANAVMASPTNSSKHASSIKNSLFKYLPFFALA